MSKASTFLSASTTISDSTTVGRAVLTAADAPAARTALSLGNASVLNVATTGNAATTEVVKGNDTRLADARTPVAHNQAASTISDSTTVGRAVLTAVDAAAARNTLIAAPRYSTRVAMAANNIDLAAGEMFTKTITGATTFTVSNVPASGNFVSILVELSSTGALGVTWWANVKWAGGAPFSITSGVGGYDVVGLYTYDGGANWTGLVLGKNIQTPA